MRTAAPPAGGMSGAPFEAEGVESGALRFDCFLAAVFFAVFLTVFFAAVFAAAFFREVFFFADVFFRATFFFAEALFREVFFFPEVFFEVFFAMAQPPCACSSAKGSAVALNRAATGANALGGLSPSSR